MISEAMSVKLNKQITAELAASHQYLAMACELDRMGFKILAKRFQGQCDEERQHAMKIVQYLNVAGGGVTLEAIAKPKASHGTVKEIVQAALDGEKTITRKIHDLVAAAEGEKDYATRSFLNWFVDEQVEEVSAMEELLKLVELAGDNILQVEARVRHEMTAAS